MSYYDTVQSYGDTCIKCPYSNEVFQDEYTWCDKVGGKHYAYGWCSDCNFQKESSANKRRKKRLNKYFRNKKYKNRLKKLCNDIKYNANTPAYIKQWANSTSTDLLFHSAINLSCNAQSPIKCNDNNIIINSIIFINSPSIYYILLYLNSIYGNSVGLL